jgi:hypothetical protein
VPRGNLSQARLPLVRGVEPVDERPGWTSSRVEYYSIDEFFFLAVPPRGGTFQNLAEAIRARIWKRVDVPVTVGIARSRTLAKLISDSTKPFGAKVVLERPQEEELLANLPAGLRCDQGEDSGQLRPGPQGVVSDPPGHPGYPLPDERGIAVAYMLCEPASHYYQIMTRSNRMPVLIGERM